MIRQGDRFRDRDTRKLCIVKTVTEDGTIILDCVDHLSQTLVSKKDLSRFFEKLGD